MSKRTIVLLLTIGTAVLLTACGRATEAEINQALEITPIPTPSAEQLAQETAAAVAAASARAVAVDSPGGGGQAVALGNVQRGRTQFTTNCAGCHRAGGLGPNLLEAGGLGSGVTTEALQPLLRDGIGHPAPPGPYPPTRLSDAAIADLAAYIQAEAGS